MSDETGSDLDGRLDEFGMTEEQTQAIQKQLRKRIGGPPNIAFMGQSGVGKSSLCNAIFGKDVALVSDVDEGTLKEESYELSLGDDTSIRLFDLPGIGHNVGRDGLYRKMYRNILPRCDVVLWLFKADSRANAADQKVFGMDILPNLKSGTPVIPVITQSDKIDPSFEWNNDAFEAGPTQKENLATKQAAAAKIVKREPNDVAVIAIHTLPDQRKILGVKELVQQIIHELPPHRQHATFRHVKEQATSARAKKEAEEGLWTTVKRVVQDFLVKQGPVILEEAGKALMRWWTKSKKV